MGSPAKPCPDHADQDILGGTASRVAHAVLACREHRQGHELDVVVTQASPHSADRVVAIGEVKATNTPVGEGAVQRLDHIRELLPADRVGRPPRLLLFAQSGFTPRLRALARPDVELVDLHRLYSGS